MLIIIAGFPGLLIEIFFAGSLLIEVIFSLDGLGLLSFRSCSNRDYPVFFGTLFIFTLLGIDQAGERSAPIVWLILVLILRVVKRDAQLNPINSRRLEIFSQ